MGVCGGAPHPSLPAVFTGPAKSWWNQAQVPMCLVTRLLFEKLKWCQENLTFAFISKAWSGRVAAQAKLFVQGGQWEGAPGRNRLQQRMSPAQCQGGGRGK